MVKKLILCALVLVSCTALVIPEKVEKKAEKVILKHFDIDSFTKELIPISAVNNENTESEFKDGNLFKIFHNDQILGYGYIGNAPSKTATFDYLVIFDQDWIISKSKVLIYREEYGGEIGSKRWLKQFIGKGTNSDELVYNQDIIPISGATISVQSMTKAINQLLGSLNHLRENQSL